MSCRLSPHTHTHTCSSLSLSTRSHVGLALKQITPQIERLSCDDLPKEETTPERGGKKPGEKKRTVSIYFRPHRAAGVVQVDFFLPIASAPRA